MSLTPPRSTFYIKDSRYLESFIEHGSVDAVLTGPPYWNEVVYSADQGQLSLISSYTEFLHNIYLVSEACSRVLRPGGILAFWVHDSIRDHQRYIPLHADLIAHMPESLTLRNILIWNRYLPRKKSLPPPLNPLGTRLQYVIILQKQGHHPRNHDLIERSLTSLFWNPIWNVKTEPRLCGSKLLFRWATWLRDRLPIDVPIHYIKHILHDEYVFKNYTTQCPPEIAARLMQLFTQQGDTILDPFAGSGITLDVAHRHHRHCIGIDINPATAHIIQNKMGQKTQIMQ